MVAERAEVAVIDGVTQDPRIIALAKSFHQLRSEGIPGIDPWHPNRLDDWLNDSGARSSGNQHAVAFVLSVWSGGAYHKLRWLFTEGQAVARYNAIIDREERGRVQEVVGERVIVAWAAPHGASYVDRDRLWPTEPEDAKFEHYTTAWPYRTPPFDHASAWAVWDNDHRAAWLAWAANPFYL